MHLGIDLGGTKIEIIALDSENKELYRKRITSPHGTYDATLSALTGLVLDAEKSLGSTGSLGIGIPGSLSPRTGLVQNANSTWLIGHHLERDLSQRLNRKLAIANDADCFALSEACDGAGAEHHCVFGVILGTGVGGGLVLQQTVLSGPNAITGEWGHNTLCDPIQHRVRTPQHCYCGKHNCIETFLSGPGMLKRYNTENNTKLSRVEQLLELSDLEGQPNSATEAMLQYAERLACALSQVVNILDPNIIVLGGGLSNIATLYETLPEAIQKYVFSKTFSTPIKQAMHGDSSGVRGAAWLGKRAI